MLNPRFRTIRSRRRLPSMPLFNPADGYGGPPRTRPRPLCVSYDGPAGGACPAAVRVPRLNEGGIRMGRRLLKAMCS
jgi:hypothetical protein